MADQYRRSNEDEVRAAGRGWNERDEARPRYGDDPRVGRAAEAPGHDPERDRGWRDDGDTRFGRGDEAARPGRGYAENDFVPHRVGSAPGDYPRNQGSVGRSHVDYSGGYSNGYSRGGSSYGSGAEWSAGGTSFQPRESFAGRGPKGYKRSDDRIREDVSDRLEQDHAVDASDIDVSVTNGEVTLAGTVSSRDQKRRAEDCVESVSGVTDVANNLRVSRQTPSESSSSLLGLGGQDAKDAAGKTD